MAPFPPEKGDYSIYLCSASWLEALYARCRAAGVPSELVKPRYILPQTALNSRCKANPSLIALAGRVITPVCCAGPQRHYIYILCDPELVALKIFAAPEVLAAAERVGVKPGTIFTEESCGTNALALAREHQRLVAIRGEQHYCKLFKDWWCVASPVKDPVGRTVGYLDISMHAEKELGLATAHLQTLVARIEDGFLQAELRARQRNGAAPAPSRLPPEVAEKLTPREREILEHLILEFTNQEIAAKLYLSLETVKKHRRNIYRKLGVQEPREFLRRLRNRSLY
ncbi:LuxR C-terminal-related transcriptional regulator [Thermodesulfitimonas autotrophica]|uniref:LuxR C-terminal-related transcriptional regulator n=1 Tax=Thermodesulfitimonas autotrophica TaxID=1894989 RepID=UPI001FE621BB|nr:LuxR C-terminal-related transcriptional regulator [Thermodesulfitimonas autotrophica]